MREGEVGGAVRRGYAHELIQLAEQLIVLAREDPVQLHMHALRIAGVANADRDLPRLPHAGRLGHLELGDRHVVRPDAHDLTRGSGTAIAGGDGELDGVVPI